MQYHIEISDDQYQDFRRAYSSAIGKVIECDETEMAIMVDDIETFDCLIYPVLLGIASKLKTSGYTEIGDIKVFLETRSSRSSFQRGVIVASYVSEDNLQQIISDPRATNTIFVTNKAELLESYLSSNKSEKIGSL